MKLRSILALLVLTAGTALAGKVSSDLKKQPADSTVTVVIQFTVTPDNHMLKAVGAKGGALKKSFKKFKGGVFTIPASRVDEISSLPYVKYISVDRVLRPHNDVTAATVGANIAQQFGWTGAGVGVAVMDSGIDANPADLDRWNSTASRVVYRESFIGSGTGDAYGHGTHVAGIIGGNGASSSGPGMLRTFRGIAPEVNLIDLRVLDENGVGSDSAVIAAIDRLIQLKDTYNIRVVNLSLGRPIMESFVDDPLCQAVEMAWNAGIVVVTAAGNNGRDNSGGNQGYGTITSPANDPFVITVGAMKARDTADRGDDAIASFSSKGPTLIDHFVKPDLLAPGNGVTSLRAPNSLLDRTYPDGRVETASYGSTDAAPIYYRMSGTSMAAPVVAGAAALLIQQNPGLTPDQIKARLMKTATKTFPSSTTALDPATGETFVNHYDLFTVGAGYLNIMAALNNTDLTTGRAMSPVAVYDEVRKAVVVLSNPVALGDTMDWDASVAWGESVAWEESVAWGESVVWGESVFLAPCSVDLGGSVAWGESVSYLDSVAWGESTISAFSDFWDASVAWGESSPIKETAILNKGER